jgi:hypothetical protein
MYEIGDYPYDYVLKFKEMPMYDTRYWDPAPNLEDLLGEVEKCECGAHHTSFPWDHLRYCSKWRKW